MRLLTSAELAYISAGDGYFTVVVTTKVPSDCANFVAHVFEKYITGEMNADEASTLMYLSHFSTEDLDSAVAGLKIVYWN